MYVMGTMLAVLERNRVCIGLGLGGMRRAKVQSFTANWSPILVHFSSAHEEVPKMYWIPCSHRQDRPYPMDHYPEKHKYQSRQHLVVSMNSSRVVKYWVADVTSWLESLSCNKPPMIHSGVNLREFSREPMSHTGLDVQSRLEMLE
jgi:hypothetical protein